MSAASFENVPQILKGLSHQVSLQIADFLSVKPQASWNKVWLSV
jgi:hypothetical protein